MSISRCFFQRRNSLLAKMPPGTCALLCSNQPAVRCGDVCYPFRQDSFFYYLTGWEHAQALLMLIKTHSEEHCMFFYHHHLSHQERLFEGEALSPKEVCQDYHFTQVFDNATLHHALQKHLKNCSHCYTLYPPHHPLIQTIFPHIPQSIIYDHQSLPQWLSDMRLYKDPNEIACMRRATELSVKAHQRVMRYCQPEQYEYQLEAEFLHELYSHGCRTVAYPSIIAGGARGHVLHYQNNNALLRAGELVLIDAGAEYNHYASDITRTFPVNGCFTARQKALYHVVLHAQNTAIAHVRPGISWTELETLTRQSILEGLLDLGLLKGPLDDLIAQRADTLFFAHGLGHWIGLDTHDVGDYQIDSKKHKNRTLEANMVITIEPGIYLHPSLHDTSSPWYGINIRIEDDILVTRSGCEVLSQALPKQVDDIESLMREAHVRTF